MSWYIVKTYAGQENVAQKLLEAKIANSGFAHLFNQVVCPARNLFDLTAKRTSFRERFTLAPGHILVDMIMTNESYNLVRNTPRIFGFMRSPGARADGQIVSILPIKDSEVFHYLSDIFAEVNPQPKQYAIGQTVQIANGPFAGASVVVSGYDQRRNVYQAEISLLGRKKTIQINPHNLA